MNCPICNAGEMDKMGRIGHYACDTAYYLEDGKVFSQGMQCIKRERDNLRKVLDGLATVANVINKENPTLSASLQGWVSKAQEILGYKEAS